MLGDPLRYVAEHAFALHVLEQEVVALVKAVHDFVVQEGEDEEDRGATEVLKNIALI